MNLCATQFYLFIYSVRDRNLIKSRFYYELKNIHIKMWAPAMPCNKALSSTNNGVKRSLEWNGLLNLLNNSSRSLNEDFDGFLVVCRYFPYYFTSGNILYVLCIVKKISPGCFSGPILFGLQLLLLFMQYILLLWLFLNFVINFST